MVYEGNFATVCINAQGLRWQLSKKKLILLLLLLLFESGQLRPCTLTHMVYEGNFQKY